jgi:hypothetical protein
MRLLTGTQNIWLFRHHIGTTISNDGFNPDPSPLRPDLIGANPLEFYGFISICAAVLLSPLG